MSYLFVNCHSTLFRWVFCTLIEILNAMYCIFI